MCGDERGAGTHYKWWNFVSSQPERSEQVKSDSRNCRFTIVTDKTEFIPLPERVMETNSFSC
jgi:hypothetical protein